MFFCEMLHLAGVNFVKFNKSVLGIDLVLAVLGAYGLDEAASLPLPQQHLVLPLGVALGHVLRLVLGQFAEHPEGYLGGNPHHLLAFPSFHSVQRLGFGFFSLVSASNAHTITALTAAIKN